MKRKLCILLLLLPLALLSQPVKRLQPGKLYDPGESLVAPRYGFKARVPENWTGILPRESEVFLLSSLTSPAEIYVLGRENSELTTLKKIWEEGFEIDSHIRLKAKEAVIANGTLSSEVVAVGAFIDKSMRAYALARCGDGGPCVTCLAVMPAQLYDQVRQAADAFLSSATFEVPSSTSLYQDFVWKEFLTNQMVTAYAFLEQGSKETTVHLCAHGQFTANVDKKGILKNQNPAYKGKLSGTWRVSGVGAKGLLHLEFDKGLPALDVQMEIKDEKIYGNGERYFVGVSDKCK